jgi:hypothetical protein
MIKMKMNKKNKRKVVHIIFLGNRESGGSGAIGVRKTNE